MFARIKWLFVILLFCPQLNCERDKFVLEPNIKPNENGGILFPTEGEIRQIDGQFYRLVSNQRKDTPFTGWPEAPDSITAISWRYLIKRFGGNYFEKNFSLRVG